MHDRSFAFDEEQRLPDERLIYGRQFGNQLISWRVIATGLSTEGRIRQDSVWTAIEEPTKIDKNQQKSTKNPF
jgi:hypothetical protein